jgi:hypothetical protein
MTSAEFIVWAEQQETSGVKDPMGFSWTTWKLAIYQPDGSVARDQNQHQIYETQAEYKARTRSVPIGQTLELFA